ncbi:hypothetical protein [Marinoscillum sp. MHG1-6]|uniref:hypothetical protein n=1 Tax=Marinoscillum sp. MHG1-6 TaxID=2959627 RepID=UPI0021584410|nr:hypothetical protein [Marinoscillum sp. MHG1-6]
MRDKINLYGVLFFITIIVSNKIIAQQLSTKAILLTYNIDNRDDNHPPEEFYWIMPITSDSVFQAGGGIYPFYFEIFSKDNLERCTDGNPIDIFVSTTSTDWNFSEDYLHQIDEMKRYCSKNKTLIQSLKRKWFTGRKDKVNVYYTLVEATFCSCNLSEESGKMINYTGKVYLPLSFREDNWTIYEKELLMYLDDKDLVLKDIANKL